MKPYHEQSPPRDAEQEESFLLRRCPAWVRRFATADGTTLRLIVVAGSAIFWAIVIYLLLT